MCSPTRIIASIISTITFIVIAYYGYEHRDKILAIFKTLKLQFDQLIHGIRQQQPHREGQ